VSDITSEEIERALQRTSHFLPSQGPISAFVHHNTLHAFERLPFEEAVQQASEIYGCQPYMDEDWYRAEYQRGRIQEQDLIQVVRSQTPNALAAPGIGLQELHLALLRYPLHEVDGAALNWHLHETGALWRLRQEVEADTRKRLTLETTEWARAQNRPLPQLLGAVPEDWKSTDDFTEKVVVRLLWTACHRALGPISPDIQPWKSRAPRLRHRDFLLQAGLGDIDELVNPVLIKVCANYLDQGFAEAPIPGRHQGLYSCFLQIYNGPSWTLPYWLRQAAPALRQSSQQTPLESALESLKILGVSCMTLEGYVRETLLVLKGWAGMLNQAGLRPDRLPHQAVPGALVDLLAVRLLLEISALRYLLAEHRQPMPLSELRQNLALPPLSPVSKKSLAFELFQVCQFLGRGPLYLESLSLEQLACLLKNMHNFGDNLRRYYWHLAYERNFRMRALDAFHLHSPSLPPPNPSFQAVFCIDEREESTRRHLEEVAPDCQTYGTPGFFSLPMYYQALHESHPVALCPVSVQPRNLVAERLNPHAQSEAERRAAIRRSLGHVSNSLEIGSRSLTWGGLLTSGLGLITAIPALLRLLLPYVAGSLDRKIQRSLLPSDTYLEIERQASPAQAQQGPQQGFTVEEMTEIVRTELENIGLRAGFAPIVLVVGHGSSSLNNPHEAAYDCGACGGGRGGPNARTFALMANHPQVRSRLAQAGLLIPEDTAFVGAYHNTCAEDIELYDLKNLNSQQLQALEKAVAALQQARARDALERCRRFYSASLDLTPSKALRHVEERAADLAQPRPELGHATNALCFIGRRQRSQGLFLDRRAFLASYNPEQDTPDSSVLERILSAVLPVVAGISLEYFFSRVDNVGYGCGSKLPHNITGLIGVMDGYSSDLRTGLPQQMVEIHEPMRLLTVIETTVPGFESLLARLEPVRRLVENRWVQLALLDPESSDIRYLDHGQWVQHLPEHQQIPRARDSVAWFHHHREHLEFAEILPPESDL